CARRFLLPAGDRFINWLHLCLGMLACWQIVNDPTLEFVTGTDLYFRESIQNIKFGQRQPVNPTGADSLPHQDRVEPAAAARAPGDDTNLAAALADDSADLVVLLGRKRPRPDPSRVGLADAEHVAHRGRAEARSGSGL